MIQRTLLLFSLLTIFFNSSCIKDNLDIPVETGDSQSEDDKEIDNSLLELTSLVIPKNFDRGQ